MATSNSANFSVSRDDIIKGALRLIGALSQGETPTTDMTTEAAEALNIMAKAFEADGMPLWALKEYAVPLTTSTASYRIGLTQTVDIPKPLKILQAFVRNTSTNIDIPMRALTRQEYNMLGNKTSSGQPIQFYYDPQRVYGDLYVFPVPDSIAATNCTIHIVYQRPFEDFDVSTDEPDFPQEWFEALKYGLASRLADEYGLDLQTNSMLTKKAEQYKQVALGFGTEEGSIYFARDFRDW